MRSIYSIRSLFNQESPEELYHQSLLADLSNKIRRSGRGSVLTNTDMISGKFISELYRVFSYG